MARREPINFFLFLLSVMGSSASERVIYPVEQSDTFMPPITFYFFSRPDMYCHSQKQLHIASKEKVNALATELIDFISRWVLVKNQSIKT